MVEPWPSRFQLFGLQGIGRIGVWFKGIAAVFFHFDLKRQNMQRARAIRKLGGTRTQISRETRVCIQGRHNLGR